MSETEEEQGKNSKIAHMGFLHNIKELELRVVTFINEKLWENGSKPRVWK